MKKLVVLTGAGISAESGIKTFRDSNGLWENHDIMEVASPIGWNKNKELVLEFYNQRRRQLAEVKPNKAHELMVELEKHFEVQIITQNIDDLHERAGSKNILHLHGELIKARSTLNEHLIYEVGYKDVGLGDKCEKGSQLRPHIVWFGEAVPNIAIAAEIAEEADILLVVGTSLNVYPAAGLVDEVSMNCKIFVIDPNEMNLRMSGVEHIKEKATIGMQLFLDKILN